MSLKIGVIVARFQVHKLHDGHIHLIESVYKQCDLVVVLLGSSKEPDDRNILPFEIRKHMLQEAYPRICVRQLMDYNDDVIWSQMLDDELSIFAEGDNSITLFGSRDSFKSHYTGKYPYEHIPEKEGLSGTAMRDEIINLRDYSMMNEYFRAGIIHGYNLAKTKEK